MLPHFLSLRPTSKRQALSYLADLDDPAVIAGGTDLVVRMKKGESHLHLVDITPIKELSGAATKGGRIVVGSAATLRELSTNQLICASAPALAEAASWIGSPQIRNMATIGGNLVNASPAADSIPPLLVHDAQLTLESRDHMRTQALETFITGPYKTTIAATEMLSAISLEPLKGYTEGYTRVAKRAAWAISRLGIAWAISEKNGAFVDVRLAIGSCTPTPFRVRNVEAFLIGKKWQNSVITDAVALCLAEIRRISGERPSFVYKLPVVRDLLRGILGGA